MICSYIDLSNTRMYSGTNSIGLKHPSLALIAHRHHFLLIKASSHVLRNFPKSQHPHCTKLSGSAILGHIYGRGVWEIQHSYVRILELRYLGGINRGGKRVWRTWYGTDQTLLCNTGGKHAFLRMAQLLLKEKSTEHRDATKILIFLHSESTGMLLLFVNFHKLLVIKKELELHIGFCWIWPVWEFPRIAWIKIFNLIFKLCSADCKAHLHTAFISFWAIITTIEGSVGAHHSDTNK